MHLLHQSPQQSPQQWAQQQQAPQQVQQQAMDVNSITSHLENLANNMDAQTLSGLYNHIKVLLGEIKRGERPKKTPTPEQGANNQDVNADPFGTTTSVQTPGGFGQSITSGSGVTASTYNNRKIKIAEKNKKRGFHKYSEV